MRADIQAILKKQAAWQRFDLGENGCTRSGQPGCAFEKGVHRADAFHDDSVGQGTDQARQDPADSDHAESLFLKEATGAFAAQEIETKPHSTGEQDAQGETADGLFLTGVTGIDQGHREAAQEGDRQGEENRAQQPENQ